MEDGLEMGDDIGVGGRASAVTDSEVIMMGMLVGMQLSFWSALPAWSYFLVSHQLSLPLGASDVSRPHRGVSMPCGCV